MIYGHSHPILKDLAARALRQRNYKPWCPTCVGSSTRWDASSGPLSRKATLETSVSGVSLAGPSGRPSPTNPPRQDAAVPKATEGRGPPPRAGSSVSGPKREPPPAAAAPAEPEEQPPQEYERPSEEEKTEITGELVAYLRMQMFLVKRSPDTIRNLHRRGKPWLTEKGIRDERDREHIMLAAIPEVLDMSQAEKGVLKTLHKERKGVIHANALAEGTGYRPEKWYAPMVRTLTRGKCCKRKNIWGAGEATVQFRLK